MKAVERKSRNFTFRSRGDLRERLEAAVQKSERSISEEIEHRLERSFESQNLLPEILTLAYGKVTAGILLALGGIMEEVGRSAGFSATGTLQGADHWWNDPYSLDQVAKAVAAALHALAPRGEVILPRSASLKGGPPGLELKARAESLGEDRAISKLGALIAKSPPQNPINEQIRNLFGEAIIARLKDNQRVAAAAGLFGGVS